MPTSPAPVDITTEKAQQLPNADFEERRKSVEYRNLPSGGRYSQTIVGIFNRQNHANIKQEAPQSWANVNAKTFCMDAARHNTWYMQPSTESVLDAYLNSYGVRIQSVGWDIDGPEIPDYRQPDPPTQTIAAIFHGLHTDRPDVCFSDHTGLIRPQ